MFTEVPGAITETSLVRFSEEWVEGLALTAAQDETAQGKRYHIRDAFYWVCAISCS